MSQPARRWISEEEYLALEERAEYKSEYFNGEIFAMAGGSPEHSLIAGNVIRELGNQLEDGPCRVYSSDLRVKIPATGLHTYPDATVVCEEPRFDDSRPRALVNPTVIIEVLSPRTEAYDRGEKFAHYQRLPSLREYVLVASDRARIERFTRREGVADWEYAVSSDPEGSLALPSLGRVLALPQVYLKVDFPPAQENGRPRLPPEPPTNSKAAPR